VKLFKIDSRDPQVERRSRRRSATAQPVTLVDARNASMHKRIEDFPELADFYNSYDELDVTQKDLDEYSKLLEGLKDEDAELLQSRMNFYVVSVKNVGGLVMPVILEATYDDGTKEELRCRPRSGARTRLRSRS
jgi:hypothetical protein